MTSGEQDEFAAGPAGGRVFAAERTVRSTDAAPDGRLRLDGLARFLQDAAEDDVHDSGWDEGLAWLVRRCVLRLRGYPRLGETVRLRTFCSALGPRWAQRTTTVSAGDRDLIQASAVWVAVSRDTGATAPLGPGFRDVYGPSAAGRTVSARLFHPGPAPDRRGRPWALRSADFDTAGHVNNSVHWAAVEDALAGAGWRPAYAEIEYPRPLRPGCEPALVADRTDDRLQAWLTDGPVVLASARLTAARK
ncbi:MAG: acyl-[acyl-carrier-protein] thioesterase [Streptosporangiaceae bacterium]